MRLWHAPARALPVTVRPVGGETIVSYARRLSAANDLPPTTILRTLGQLTGSGTGKHLLICDTRLNEQAAGRLETCTGIPRPRLSRALPALRGQLHPASRCRRTGRPSASTGCIPGQPAASASWPRQARPGRPSCSCPAGLRWPAGVTGAGSALTMSPASTICPQPGTSSPPTVASPGSWPAAATAPGPTANSLPPGTWPRTGPGASPGACPSSASDGATGQPHSASPRPGSSRPGS